MCVPNLPSGSEDVLFLSKNPFLQFITSLQLTMELQPDHHHHCSSEISLAKVTNDLITKSNSQFCLLTSLIFDAVDHSFSWNTSARLGLPFSLSCSFESFLVLTFKCYSPEFCPSFSFHSTHFPYIFLFMLMAFSITHTVVTLPRPPPHGLFK